MKKLILVMCPSWGPELPPLNLALLKSSMESRKIPTWCIDLNLDAYHFGNNKALWNKNALRIWTNPDSFHAQVLSKFDEYLDKWAQIICTSEAKYVGFSVLDSNVLFTNELARRIKSQIPKILFAGGPEIQNKHTRVKLDKSFDYFFSGEGEEAIADWIDWLEGDHTKSIPDGVYPLSDGLFRDVPFRSIANLNAHPLPDYSDFALELYTEKALPILGSRSCIFKCKFCTDYQSMGNFRSLDGDRLFETLVQAVDLGFHKVWFNDLLINGIIKELRYAFQALESKGKFLQWIALATPNKQLKSDDLRFFKTHGLKTLNLGLESGSEKVMKLMKKGFDRKSASEALKRIHSTGINTQLNMIVGFPGETEADFQQTLEFLDEHFSYISGFTSVNTCIMLPGSDIYEQREVFGASLPPDKDPTKWFIGNENTHEIREDRLARLRDWIQDHGYDIYSSNC